MAIFEKKMPSVGPKSPEDQGNKPKNSGFYLSFCLLTQNAKNSDKKAKTPGLYVRSDLPMLYKT